VAAQAEAEVATVGQETAVVEEEGHGAILPAKAVAGKEWAEMVTEEDLVLVEGGMVVEVMAGVE
jgi:hypothetical protein